MTRVNPRLKAKLLRELEENPLVTRACKKLGIARSTFYRWCDEDFKFRADTTVAINRGRDKISDFAESKLYENAGNGNQQAIALILRHNSKHYRPQVLKLVIEENSQQRVELERLQLMFDELIKLKGVDALIDSAVSDPEAFKQQLRDEVDESRRRTDEL